MKKLIVILSVLLSSVSAWAQEREYASLEDIEQGWKTKTIDNVINGSLGIMLERFDQTWPTWMVGALRNTMEKGLAKEVLDEETGLMVTIDIKNGYAEVNDGGTDGAYMSACYWNRNNGHKLLAVCLGKPTDPFIDFVCFYDYDPQQKTLTPEPDILKGYRWGDRDPYTQIFCHLPKVGKDVVVEEWGEDGPVRHTFTWDGMQPVYAKTEPFDYDDGIPADGITVSYKGDKPTIKDFVEAFLSPEDVGEALGSLKDAWELYREGMKLMPGEELIVDTQYNYVGYDSEESDTERMVIECRAFDYADGHHTLVALSNDYFVNDKAIMGQYTGLEFFVYDTDTRKMQPVYDGDIGIDIDFPTDVSGISHKLPRAGQTIVYILHTSSGKLIEKSLTWNGSVFIEQ